eukprot:TRINITY_DN5745_c0_g1_i3.p1 TRINITY_DN5745_c0_g1~~TRINITY_DN5745_c0_g1_i3.p1  ORF type:complete len:469 (+),score=14.40 TRINITY_DN5745_c0_g1_i3:81-1487(+)
MSAGTGVYVWRGQDPRGKPLFASLPGQSPLPGQSQRLPLRPLGASLPVHAVAASSDGRVVVCVGGPTSALQLWQTNSLVADAPDADAGQHHLDGAPRDLAVLSRPDGGCVCFCIVGPSGRYGRSSAGPRIAVWVIKGRGAQAGIAYFNAATEQMAIAVSDWAIRGLGLGEAGVATAADQQPSGALQLWTYKLARRSPPKQRRGGYGQASHGYDVVQCASVPLDGLPDVPGKRGRISIAENGSIAAVLLQAGVGVYSISPAVWSATNAGLGDGIDRVAILAESPELVLTDLVLHRALPLVAGFWWRPTGSDDDDDRPGRAPAGVQVYHISEGHAGPAGGVITRDQPGSDAAGLWREGDRPSICFARDGRTLFINDIATSITTGVLSFAGEPLRDPALTLADAGVCAEAVVDLQGSLPPPSTAPLEVRGPALDIAVRPAHGDVFMVTVAADATVGDLADAVSAALQCAAE